MHSNRPQHKPKQPLRPSPKGAYSKVNVDDPSVQKMANFATKTILKENENLQEAHYKLSSVESAEIQVVSGFNYKMCLKLKGKNQVDQICNVRPALDKDP